MPGAVDTAITEHSGVAAPERSGSDVPMTSAADAARTMVTGIERDRLHVYVGKDARAMSIAIKVAPRRAIRFVQQQMAKRGVTATSTRG